MSNTSTIRASHDGHSAKIEIKLPVVLFQDENNIWIAHIPALDLSGYGNTENEAKASLDIVMNEYFEYAVKNHTLHADLKRHGWQLNKEVKTPELSESLANNPLKDIINNKPDLVKITNRQIQIPAYC